MTKKTAFTHPAYFSICVKIAYWIFFEPWPCDSAFRNSQSLIDKEQRSKQTCGKLLHCVNKIGDDDNKKGWVCSPSCIYLYSQLAYMLVFRSALISDAVIAFRTIRLYDFICRCEFACKSYLISTFPRLWRSEDCNALRDRDRMIIEGLSWYHSISTLAWHFCKAFALTITHCQTLNTYLIK